MALEKYKVLESSIKDGIAYLPEKAIPLGIWTFSESAPSVVVYKMNVAFMMKYKDWAEEFPEEALKEVLVYNAEEKTKEDKEEGIPNAK